MPRPSIVVDVGETYGRLTILTPPRTVGAQRVCDVLCVCGTPRVVPARSLTNGNTRSCGCLQREAAARNAQLAGDANRRHGMSATRIYRVWQQMLNRCENPNEKRYADYGGRGIRVCARWHKFENFLADMGDRPQGLSIDRIDNDGDYEPGNCKWSTPLEQAANRRPKRKREE